MCDPNPKALSNTGHGYGLCGLHEVSVTSKPYISVALQESNGMDVSEDKGEVTINVAIGR